MRVLVALQSPEYVRYIEAAIRELGRAGHDVFLAVMRENKRGSVKRARVDADDLALGDDAFAGVVPATSGLLGRFKDALRGTVDFLRFLHPDQRHCHALRERMQRRALPRALGLLDRIASLSPALLNPVVRFLCAFDGMLPRDRAVLRYLRQLDPDLVVAIPMVAANSTQAEIAWCARTLRIPVAVCIASWDNLTNKGLIKAHADRVLVWNDAQKEEAVRYHHVPRERISITGAPVFDRWFDVPAPESRAAFCHAAGLDEGRPYLLYVGSSSFIAPGDSEITFVSKWLRALRTSRHRVLRETGVLIRPHPYCFPQWEGVDLSMLEHVILWPAVAPVLGSDSNERDFYHSIYHSAAVVGVNTSAMIEAAIIGRPVFTVQVAEFARGQGETLHFNYLLNDNGGVARSAGDLDTHCDQLAGVLDGSDAPPDFRGFIDRFVRPAGPSEAASHILARELVAMATATSEKRRTVTSDVRRLRAGQGDGGGR